MKFLHNDKAYWQTYGIASSLLIQLELKSRKYCGEDPQFSLS